MPSVAWPSARPKLPLDISISQRLLSDQQQRNTEESMTNQTTYTDRLPIPDGNDLETCTVTGSDLNGLQSYLEAYGYRVTGFNVIDIDNEGEVWRVVGEKIVGADPFLVSGASSEVRANA